MGGGRGDGEIIRFQVLFEEGTTLKKIPIQRYTWVEDLISILACSDHRRRITIKEQSVDTALHRDCLLSVEHKSAVDLSD